MAFGQYSGDFWSCLTGRFRPAAMFGNNGFDDEKKEFMKAMARGVMIATSTLVPIVCRPALGLGEYLKPVVGLWIGSTTCYGVSNCKTIIKNGPIVLALLPLAGLLIFLSPRPFSELPPLLPLCLATGLLLSVSVIPWAERTFRPEHGPTLREYLQGDEDARAHGTQAGTNSQNSDPSGGSSNGQVGIPLLHRMRSLDFAYLGLFGNTHYQPGSTAHGSDIDLEEGFGQNLASRRGSVSSRNRRV